MLQIVPESGETLMDHAAEFKKSGFTVVRNLLDCSDVERLYEYTLKNVDLGNMNDGQVPGTPAFYQDKEIAILQKKILPLIEELIQIKLFTTFCYHRTYRTGAILRIHQDRSACEISISLNLGQKGTPWDLWLLDYNENAHNITFAPGDAVIYRGSKLKHWRGKLIDADFVSQVFLHFVAHKSKYAYAMKTELFTKFLANCKKMLGIYRY